MIHLFDYSIITFAFFLFFNSVKCLNFIIPLPNTLIFAGTSSLVTWSIGTSNLTSTNLYLANGADPNNLVVFSILGQNLPSSKTSMMANIPKDAPNDNTFLLLVGNDTPASRATVPLNIVFGNSNSTVSPIPTASTIPTPSPNITTTTTIKPTTTTSSTLSSSTKPSNTSPATSETPSPSSSESVSSSTIIGAVIGGIVAIGLVGAIILICLRRQKRKREKRHTELFDDKGIDFTGYHEDTNHYQNTSPSSQQQYYHHHQQQQPSPFLSPTESYPMDQMSYARSMTYNQPPPAVLQYPMKTIDSTNMRDNGFQSRTQLENISPSTIIASNNNDSTMTFNSKPNEIDSQKPHAK
ncbi:hypothetical protein BJ944DRAFT_287168 [Cunninghamella echinulata]|nr:hypothetical protein BJ944DRAFT_287168 [Cunninghamella echinulata]